MQKYKIDLSLNLTQQEINLLLGFFALQEKGFATAGKKLSSSSKKNRLIFNVKQIGVNEIDLIQFIVETTSLYFKIKKGTSETKAKQINHFFARVITNLSTKVIGEKIGEVSHATVLHSLKMVKYYYSTDPLYQKNIEGIKTLLKSRGFKIDDYKYNEMIE